MEDSKHGVTLWSPLGRLSYSLADLVFNSLNMSDYLAQGYLQVWWRKRAGRRDRPSVL